LAVNDYCSVGEIKAAMPDQNWGTSYDSILTSLITRASRMLDRCCGRKPGAFYVSADTTRFFDAPAAGSKALVQGWASANQLSLGSGDDLSSLWIDEGLAAAPTSVAISLDGSFNYTPLVPGDYILWPYNALEEGQPYLRIDLDILYGHYSTWYGFRRGVQIVGKFGFSTIVPDDVKQAAIIQTARWFKRGQQMYQDLIRITDNAQEVYANRIDPDIAAMVQHLRWVAV
jgi:hypothetical protein